MKRSKKLKYDHIALFAEGDQATQEIVGTVFRKQIAKFGKWVNPLFPIEFMELDKEWAKSIVDNFNAGVIDRVPVPLDHTDQTEANTGEVIKLEIQDDGIYGYLDIRRPNVVEDIVNGLIFDVSISFDWDYIDTENGDHHGPTLLHVALVNNPYLKGMPAFEEATQGSFSKHFSKLTTALALPNTGSVIMLSESKVKELSNMEEATVKNDKAYAVEITVKVDDDDVTKTLAPGEETTVPKDQAEAVLSQIEEAVDPEADKDADADKDQDADKDADKDSDKDKDADADKDEDEDESEQDKKDREELSELRAEKAFNALLSEGYITPAQKDKFMELSKAESKQAVNLSRDGKTVSLSLSEAMAELLKAGPKVAKFSENGSSKDGDEDADKDKDTDKKPSENMSEAELRGMQATGADPKRADELAAKYPAMAEALSSKNKDNEEK